MSDRTPQPEPCTQEAPVNDSCHLDIPTPPGRQGPRTAVPSPLCTELQWVSISHADGAGVSLPARQRGPGEEHEAAQDQETRGLGLLMAKEIRSELGAKISRGNQDSCTRQ